MSAYGNIGNGNPTDSKDLIDLINMGFERERAIRALTAAPDFERALNILTNEAQDNPFEAYNHGDDVQAMAPLLSAAETHRREGSDSSTAAEWGDIAPAYSTVPDWVQPQPPMSNVITIPDDKDVFHGSTDFITGSPSKSYNLRNRDASGRVPVKEPTAADADLQKAIELSMQEKKRTTRKSTAAKDEETDLNAAILNSIEEQHKDSAMDDLRAEGHPAGLKNVGNTCYVNSLIQSYYFFVPFRNMILQLEFPEELYAIEDEVEHSLQQTTSAPVFGPQLPETVTGLKGGNEFPPPKSQSEHDDTPHHSDDGAVQKKRRSEKSTPAEMVKRLVSGIQFDKVVGDVTMASPPIESHIRSDPGPSVQPSAPPQELVEPATQPTEPVKPAPATQSPISEIASKLKALHISSLRALRFLNELQLLFVLMQFSKKAVLDPSVMLSKLYGYNDVRVVIGEEQDICEFNNLFLHNIEGGLKAMDSLAEGSGHLHKFKQLFYGQTVQILINSPDPNVQKGEFAQIVLAIPSAFGRAPTLNDALHQFTSPTAVENSNTGLMTSFETLPSLLLFQIQRVIYSATQRCPVKILRPLELPLQIAMERYLQSRSEDAAKIRATIETPLKECYRRLCCIHDTGFDTTDYAKAYEGSSVVPPSGDDDVAVRLNTPAQRVDIALDTTLRHLRKRRDLEPTPQNEAIYTEMCNIYEEMQNKIKALEGNVAELSANLENAYSSFTAQSYVLHSILIHAGSTPYGGHYYSYICVREGDRSAWFRISDSNVGIASWNDIAATFKEGTSTAYCCSYIVSDQAMAAPLTHAELHARLKAYIESHNDVKPTSLAVVPYNPAV